MQCEFGWVYVGVPGLLLLLCIEEGLEIPLSVCLVPVGTSVGAYEGAWLLVLLFDGDDARKFCLSAENKQ